MNNKNEHQKIALITGATSGIGTVVAEHLVKNNYRLIVLGRSKTGLDVLQQKLNAINSACEVEHVLCDLSSFKSVDEACSNIKQHHDCIDLLILNAGLWNFKFSETEDKIEETFQVNLLSSVLLFEELSLLLPKDGTSKVIFTSSGLHQGEIYFSDPEFRTKFSGFRAYRQSKLGLLLLTRLFAQSPNYSGISFYAVHPGMVNTKLGRNAGWFSNFIFRLFGKSAEKGASTHLYLIDQDPKTLSSGAYYANSKITKATRYSSDLVAAEKLLGVVHRYFDEHKKIV